MGIWWSYRCRTLVIGLIALAFIVVDAVGPTVVSSSYTKRSLAFFDVASDVALMAFDFDQDIFYQQQCTARPFDLPLEPTVYVPCCNATLTTGCVTPSTSFGRCIDPTVQYDEEYHFPGNAVNKFAYEFKVANPNTCHSVLIGAAMQYGITTIKLFNSRSNFIAGQNEIFYRGFSGSNGLFSCCPLIRARTPGWDGTLYVQIVLQVDSKWTTQLLGSPIIPSVDYFVTNRIEVHCPDGYNFTRCFPQLTGGCWPMPSVLNDPAYYYVTMSAGFMPDGEISSRRLNIGLVLNTLSFANGNSSATFLITDPKVLDPASQCQITFPFLVNKDGEPANPTAMPIEKPETDCSSEKFSGVVDDILALIDNYSNSNSSSIEVAVQQFILGLGKTWQKDWTACFSFITNELLQRKIESVSFNDSTYCPYTNISDPLYLNDPCCNVRQQELQCCRPRDIIVDYEQTAVNADAVANQCQRPKCITDTIADFMTLQQSSADRLTGCTATTSKNLDSSKFSTTIQSCYATMFEIFCATNAECRTSTQLDQSLCVQGKCTVPCTNNEECLSNQCSTVELFNKTIVPSCVMYNLLDANNMPFDKLATHFIECANRTIDPVLFVYIARAVGATEISTSQEVASALTKSLGVDQCVGFSSLLFPSIGISGNFSTQESCTSSESCTWAPCDSNSNSHCNSTYCNPPDVPDHFCGFCLYDQCFEVSSFPVCKYLALPSEQNCTRYSGHYNPLNAFYPAKCIRPSAVGECYPPQYCSQTSGNCPAKCYVPVYADAGSCNGQDVGGQTASWQTWTRSSMTYGLCTVPVTTLDACLNLSPDARFWPGTVYSADNDLQANLNTQAICSLFGACNLDLTSLDINQLQQVNVTLESQCDQSRCYGQPARTNAEDCDNDGYCNDWTGCYLPFLEDRSIPAPCPENTLWTPKGCFVEAGIIGRPEDCLSPNEWKTISTTRADCESLKLCTEQAIVNAVSISPRDRAARVSTVSFKDEEECAKCGGKFEPYYEWKSFVEWVAPSWRSFEWRKREMKTLNKWTTLMDQSKATDMTYAVVARRYSDILSSELLCRLGEIQSAVSSVVCDCTDKSNNCPSTVSSVRDPAVGLVQICTGAAFSQSFARGIIYSESPTLVGGMGCAPVRVGVVPISQFNSRQTITLSSVSLSSSRDAQDGQERFYKNSNNIVVGEVLGDGLSIDFLGRQISNVKACIFFPDPTTSSLPDVTQFAVFSIPRGSRDLNITINNPMDVSEGQYCFDVANAGEVYFVIALVDGWEGTDFSTTLSAGELALVAIGIILYLIVLFAAVYHFAVSIATRDTKKPLLTQSRIALGLLIIFLIIRVLYLILFVSGTFNKSQSADVIFSELPALVFLNIYCIIVLRWAALYHFGLKDGAKGAFRRLKPVLYVFDGVLAAAFITLLIVYFSLSDQITITCESDDVDVNAATPKQIVAIVYKAFFAVVCIILSIAFLVYGSRIIRSSTSFTVRSLDRAEQRAIKKRKQDVLNKIVITVVCTLCLLGQAANLLRASATNEPGILILIFLYPIELLPSIMFIIILKKVPFFYHASLLRKPKVEVTRNWRRSVKLQSHITSKKRNAAYGEINARLIAEEEAEETANTVPMSDTFNDETNIAFAELKVAQEIGTGNYGKVNLGTWKGSQVALKRSKAFERTEFVREAKLVMTLPPHQNVVQTFGLTNDGFNLMVVMEYCSGGSLDVKLFDLPDPISDQEKLAVLIGIAQGMQHLHQNKIIHRDLAARNILINNNVPKVSDFGLSRKVDDVLKNSTTRNNVGPIRWMAPEALRDGTYSAKTDVWSFGIVMFEVLAQSEPHVEEDPLFIGIKIRDGAFFPRLPATSTSDQVLRNLMEQCCRKDPNERPDFNNICQVLVNRWNELYGKM